MLDLSRYVVLVLYAAHSQVVRRYKSPSHYIVSVSCWVLCDVWVKDDQTAVLFMYIEVYFCTNLRTCDAVFCDI